MYNALKQSTGSQAIEIGPVISPTDGSFVTNLLVANFQISKAGGGFAALHTTTFAYDANGCYLITLDATDTNTLGALLVGCTADICASKSFQVVTAAVWAALTDASTPLVVNTTKFANQTITCGAGVTIYPAVGAAHELTVDASGRIDVGSWVGSAVTKDGNNLPNVNASDLGGTSQTGADVGMISTAATSSSATSRGYLAVQAGNPDSQNGIFTPFGAYQGKGSFFNATSGQYLWYDSGSWFISSAIGVGTGAWTGFALATPIGNYTRSAHTAIAITAYNPATNAAGVDVASAAGQQLANGTVGTVTDATHFALTVAAGATPAKGQWITVTHSGVPTQTQITAINAGVYTVSPAVPSVTAGDTWTMAQASPQGMLETALPADVLVNAPTGPTYNLSGVTVIGGLTPLPVSMKQYCGFSLPVPVATSQVGNSHKFAVVALSNRSTILWSVGDSGCTVSDDGLTVTVAADGTNTQTGPANGDGWYYFLQDLTHNLCVAEGPIEFEVGPQIT